MAIDYSVDFDCIPKQALTTEGIMERLKGEERAQKIISLFRQHGDDRPPSEMGFEFTRSTPEGTEETRIVIVQDLLDEAFQLKPYEHHCVNCPANIHGRPFGCIGFIQYPISRIAEQWLMDRLPVPDEPLVWLLLRQGVKEFEYDGHSVRPLRDTSDAYFEERSVLSRKLGEFVIDTNQLFEMIFAVGSIYPNHGALLLLFLHAVNRDLEADVIMNIAPAPPDVEEQFPFIMKFDDEGDPTIEQLKMFLFGLYSAWKLGVSVTLDV